MVAQHFAVTECGCVTVADDDEALDRLQLVDHACEHRHERVVDDHDLVLGVVDDVRELLGEQPDVQRVQHRAEARDREVRLEVLLRVPAERADAVAVDARPAS